MDNTESSEYQTCMTADVEPPIPNHSHNHNPYQRDKHGKPATQKKRDIFDEDTNSDDLPAFVKARNAMKKQNRAAMKKLLLVTFLSAIFMSVEIVGGLMANSIAIISDAAHLFSDVLGLAVSVCALAIAQRNANKTYSYGYHRVEVLGAIISILAIWVMAAALIYEATMRFYNPPEIGGKVMFGTAILSMVFNLIQIKILHSGEGGHVHAGGQKCNHGHDHGDSHGHKHDHAGHDHSGHDHHGHDHSAHKHDHHGHDHHGHDHSAHKHDHHGHDHSHSNSHGSHAHDHSNQDAEHSHNHGHHGHDHKNTTGEDHDHVSDQPNQQTDNRASVTLYTAGDPDNLRRSQVKGMNATFAQSERPSFIMETDPEAQLLTEECRDDARLKDVNVDDEIEDESEDAKYAPAKRAKKRNLNVEAAYLHVLGDLMNSIGVIIASSVILIWPNFWYIDPCCTYFFSIIVFYTTFKTFGRCIATFLEASPDGIDYDEVEYELTKINGVEDVHDLHIWSLSDEKNALTVHLTLKDTHLYRQQEVLGKADALIREKFGINHLTIQVETERPNEIQGEPEKGEKYGFNCGNDLHI